MMRWTTRAAAAAIAAVTLAAQPLDRLSGKVVTDSGEPIKDADVRVEAIFGFAGGEFLGQRTYTTRTGAKGDWAVLGFKSGVWMFEASIPGHVPDVVALPFNLVVPAGTGLNGIVPVWRPILRPTPLPDGEMGQVFAAAIEAARADRPERVAPLLARVTESSNASLLEAAGRICLLMRDATVARPFFRRAAERDPASFRAALGMGSTALMQREVDAAGRAFNDARARTKDKDERTYLTAAIAELNKAHNIMRATP